MSITPHILLLGGHGKISLLLTPLLLAKGYNVTSVIRNADHKDDILRLGQGQKGKIDVLIESLEEVKSEGDAKRVLDIVGPDWVVWSAGAGGKGPPSRTFTIDRDSCKHYIKASLSSPSSSIRKFLLISYIGSRRNRPHWWTDDDWNTAQQVNNDILANYFKAKIDADEYLTALTEQKNRSEKKEKERGNGGAGDGKGEGEGDKKDGFQAICLRPGTLTDGEGTGKVTLGHTRARGSVRRADVAEVVVALLEREDSRGWLDLLEGEEVIGEAVERCCGQGVDCFEGEDYERVYALAD